MTTLNRIICALIPDHKEQRDAMLTYESYQQNLKSSLQQEPLADPKTFTMPVMYPVYDQSTYGSCVANACAYSILTQSKNTINISRLFVYANSRLIDYVPLNQDIGTTILSTCKALTRYGACPETLFPHSTKKPSELPSLDAYKQSVLLPSFSYYNISRDLNVLKSCLQNGKPIIFGVIVYSSFLSQEVTKTGKVPMPNKTKETKFGGHCVCMVGYNDINSTFICANSWGSQWGQNGFFFLPYNYVKDFTLSIDFTVLTFSTAS
jgi:C1A family cysteine protease